MYIHKLPSAAACKITVTATSTLLNALIGTAGSVTYNFEPGMNALDIIPEDGDIRVLFDGNTPTAANGVLLKQGAFYSFRGVPLGKMRLIRASGDVICSIQVGRAENNESGMAALPASVGPVTVDSEFPAAAALADNTANPTTTSVAAMAHVFDGATWDRAPGTAADGLLVNLGANNDVVEGNSAAILAAVDGVEALLTTIDADTGSILTSVDGIEALLTTIDADTSLLADAIKADDAAFVPATTKVVMLGAQADESAADSVDEGDAGALRMTLDRRLITASDSTDDAAPETGTRPSAIGAVADEAATDSVDEGDLGFLRMTLNRRLIASSETTDDAAMETGTKVSMIGAVADETAPDSVDEGDAGYVRMDLARNLRVTEASTRGPGVPSVDSYTHASFNLAAGNDQVLVASAPNKQIWVYGMGFTLNVAGTVSFQDEDNTAITGIMNFAAAGGMAISPSGNFSMPIWKLGTDKDLEVDVVTSELDGWIDYAIISV